MKPEKMKVQTQKIKQQNLNRKRPREQTEETEVIEAVYGTRKEYMDRLSEQGMAEYMADEYKSHRLLVTDLANTWNLRKWLSEKVDRFGKPMEDAR